MPDDAAQSLVPVEISVLTGVYNTPAAMIAECADSLASQTFTEFEWIVVDDGSTDPRTVAALDRLSHDPRVRLVRLPENRTLGPALNVALREALAPWAARMDADDVAMPGWLASQRSYARAHPEASVIGCQILFFNHGSGEHFRATAHPAVVAAEHGEPLVVYHGSKDADFTEFDPSRSSPRDRLYFAADPSYASQYATDYFHPARRADLRFILRSCQCRQPTALGVTRLR